MLKLGNLCAFLIRKFLKLHAEENYSDHDHVLCVSAVCEKCGAIGVRHAFYTRERRFCSLECARGEQKVPAEQPPLEVSIFKLIVPLFIYYFF